MDPTRQVESRFGIHKAFPVRAHEMHRQHAMHHETAPGGTLGELVGTCPAMQAIFATIGQVAPTSATVLICGETGTGKELVAREIHRLSPRRAGPFVPINAAALPESLIESELFGHEKGAFTGALESRAGCFEQAHGGTLFLDEIGAMPASGQPKLLRILEDLRVRRLGGKSEIPVNARVLAATSHSVTEQLCGEIYYRLSVFQIVLPPLRERADDIPLIAEAILQDVNRKHNANVTGFDLEVLAFFRTHDWPGNVRELRNVIERATIVANTGPIRLHHLPFPNAERSSSLHSPKSTPLHGCLTLAPGQPLSQAEAAYIKLTLEYVNYNRKRAAEILEISLRTLQSRISEFRKEATAAAVDSPAID